MVPRHLGRRGVDGDRRRAAHLGDGLGVDAGPLRADGESLRGGPRPRAGRRGSSTRREWPRRVLPARPGADGAVPRPVLGAVAALRARDRLLRHALAGRRCRATPRRTGAPCSPSTGGGARRSSWRSRAGGCTASRRPRSRCGRRTRSSRWHRRSRARSTRAGGGEWAVRASNRALARRARGRGERPAAPARPDPARAPARGALPPSPARADRTWWSGAAAGCGSAASPRSRRWRTALRPHDEQGDVVLAALLAVRARAARGRPPRPAGGRRRRARRAAAPSRRRSRACAPRSGRPCRRRASRAAGSSRRGGSYSLASAPSGGPGRASAKYGSPSRGTISGGRCPASENVSCRGHRVVERGEHGRHRQVQQRRGAHAQVREHAVGRVAVVGVGREHGAQLAHAGGGLGAVAHHVADHEQHAARPRAGGRCRSRRRRRARRCRGGSAWRARCPARPGARSGSRERCSVSASRRSEP